MTDHVINATRVHHEWDLALEPSLTIQSGDSVRFDLAMAGRGQVEFDARYEDTAFDFSTMYNLLGPIWIVGAEPGDSIEIEVIELETGEWGWTAIIPGLGLLPEDFPDPYLRTFKLRGEPYIEVATEVGVPFAPFLGTMGTHPGEPATLSPFPPHRGGGNIDNRHLIAGSSLLLPVWCHGGLFSCGDPHAAQGDGEVCVSAVECDMRAHLRFWLHKEQLDTPMFNGAPTAVQRDANGYVGTMGIAPDLMDGAKIAVRAMISWLGSEVGLAPEDAYVLCSLAGDLKVHEIVDSGVWNVGLTMPRAVFELDSAR